MPVQPCKQSLVFAISIMRPVPIRIEVSDQLRVGAMPRQAMTMFVYIETGFVLLWNVLAVVLVLVIISNVLLM